MANEVQTSTRSFREIVEKADDKSRVYDSLYPVVYKFGDDRTFRDSGPNAGPYSPE